MYLELTTSGSAAPNLETEPFYTIPSRPKYEISLSGVIRHIVTGRILTTRACRSNVRYYVCARIGRVHRLLVEAVTGRVLLPHELVLHRNGNTFDNRLENLRIGSARDNARDRIISNTNGRKLKNQDVAEIRVLSARLTRQQLADQYGVSRGHLSAILAGRSWANLS